MNQQTRQCIGRSSAWILVAFACGAAHAQTLEILSKSAAGVLGNADSHFETAVSSDGRFVGFSSTATNLVPGVTASGHAYLVDRTAQTIEVLTLANGGPGLYGLAAVGGISDDGRFVTFSADGLLDFDYGRDIYVRDRVAGTTVELTPYEFQGLQRSTPQISGNGQYVAWWERNTWFPPSDSTTIVVRTKTGALVALRSANASGNAFDAWVFSPKLSGDGRYVVYQRRDATGSMIVRWEFGAPGQPEVQVAFEPAGSGTYLDAAGVSRDGRYVAYTRQLGASDYQTWLRDMNAGTAERIDPSNNGGPIERSQVGGISNDGRFVAFTNWSSNLVAGDTNSIPDAFVRDRWNQQTARISVSVTGAQANQRTDVVTLEPSGAGAVFVSPASNLASGDTNGAADVFYRSMCPSFHADADGDGFGAGSGTFTCGLAPAGYVPNDDDCDDANAARNPQAVELCNGVDDDCDGAIDDGVGGASYCTSTPSMNGCVAHMSSVGCPSVSQSSGFTVRANSVDGQRSVMLFYGPTPTSVPFTPPNTMCVAAPRQRLPLLSSGGTAGACDGGVALDFLSWAAGQTSGLLLPLVAGQQVHFQAWFRDPSSSAGFRLSDGWATTLTQ